MAYSQAQVIAGGLTHIPVVIGLFWMFDRRTSKINILKKTTKKTKEVATVKPVETILEDKQEEKVESNPENLNKEPKQEKEQEANNNVIAQNQEELGPEVINDDIDIDSTNSVEVNIDSKELNKDV